MLKIYNSLTQQKSEFIPLQANTITMYVCGMTVYDHCHLGHARVLVAFDVVTRYLRQQGYNVNYVRNITDVDDKIINRANENGEPIDALTERFIDAMHEDERALGILPPDAEPRATRHMDEIISMIETLIEKGIAYVATNGDVYYSVHQFENYGQLAHKDIESLQAGARVEVTDVKKDPLDFVLWKLAKPNEPSWDSPWDKGRPGWHIECSAMSIKCLGNHFDIHGGGFDLQFPHHENEIAQSEVATGETFVNTWMHVGFLTINKEKMSKSLGNFFTIRDILAKYPPEVVRYFLISSHYRSQLNYSTENLDIAHGALERFYIALRDVPPTEAPKEHEFKTRFEATMNDDFNTPEALAVLFDLVREVNRIREDDFEQAQTLTALLKELADILGVLQLEPAEFLHGDVADDDTKKIEALIAEREQARADKNWGDADRLRDELHALGVELEDSSSGTIWRKN